MSGIEKHAVERFMRHVEKVPSGCWEWRGSVGGGGYGNAWLNGRTEKAHRVSYRIARGPIPDGLVIDHLCRNRVCVNPDHLEAVTPKENTLRGLVPYGVLRTTCRNGHDITDGKNVYVNPDGYRVCRTCARSKDERRRPERLAALRSARAERPKPARTQCVAGHEFTDENTYVTGKGKRQCRRCVAERSREYRIRKAAKP